MKDKQQKVNAYLDMLDNTIGKNEFTLLELIREMNLTLTISQQSRLGVNISKFARAKGIGYTKVRQTENNRILAVNSYPSDCKYILRNQVKRFLETLPTGDKPKRNRIKYVRV